MITLNLHCGVTLHSEVTITTEAKLTLGGGGRMEIKYLKKKKKEERNRKINLHIIVGLILVKSSILVIHLPIFKWS